MNQLMTNPMFNIGMGLLSANQPSFQPQNPVNNVMQNLQYGAQLKRQQEQDVKTQKLYDIKLAQHNMAMQRYRAEKAALSQLRRGDVYGGSGNYANQLATPDVASGYQVGDPLATNLETMSVVGEPDQFDLAINNLTKQLPLAQTLSDYNAITTKIDKLKIDQQEFNQKRIEANTTDLITHAKLLFPNDQDKQKAYIINAGGGQVTTGGDAVFLTVADKEIDEEFGKQANNRWYSGYS